MSQHPLDYRRMTPAQRAYFSQFSQFGRPGYETTSYGGGAPDAEWITETLPNGWTRQTRAGTRAARGRHTASGTAARALELRQRQLELLRLAAR